MNFMLRWIYFANVLALSGPLQPERIRLHPRIEHGVQIMALYSAEPGVQTMVLSLDRRLEHLDL